MNAPPTLAEKIEAVREHALAHYVGHDGWWRVAKAWKDSEIELLVRGSESIDEAISEVSLAIRVDH